MRQAAACSAIKHQFAGPTQQLRCTSANISFSPEYPYMNKYVLRQPRAQSESLALALLLAGWLARSLEDPLDTLAHTA